MFTHFLVPLDGSALAEAILPVARTLAHACHARVTLLHVVEPAAPATIHGQAHLMNADAAERYLKERAHELAQQGIAADWHVDVAEGGDIVQAIFAHGLELRADLILLADHGASGLKSHLLGSIPQQVLHRGEIPVLLVCTATLAQRAFQCQSVLVPLDSSALYETALAAASEIARASHATLHLVIVVPTVDALSPERSATGMILPTSTRAVLDLAENGARQYLAAKLDELHTQQLKADGHVARGDVVTKILEQADSVHADLLVMATHGRAGLDAFWSGSIAPRVVKRATVPILLLRVTGDEPVR
ncbi:MAG: universal stress protein [Chloroflexi bacterium]|nr:universal stress protein [Chloroflexota bacterium]